MKTYYYIYKITILKGCWKGKYYIGKHETTNLDDNYLGSGVKITTWFKRKERIEGVDYKKEILCYCKDVDEMWKMENYYISDKYETDDMCLNCMEGGHGGHLSTETIQKISDIANSKTPEEKEQINKKRRDYYNNNPEIRKRANENIRKAVSGRCWLNNGDEHIMPKLEDAEYFKSQGFIEGSGFHTYKTNRKERTRKSKYDLYIEQSFRKRNLRNRYRTWFNNGVEEIWILPDDIEYRKSIGFVEGRLPMNEDKHNNSVTKWKETFYSNTETYIERGKKISKENKGRIHINNGKISKMVKAEELPTYLANGWVKGRLKKAA